ncbi:NADP-dependent oxidoreductase [Alicyclobacillus fastidiosus]|uniref:NADP-dependent oxidoreductase n=1 Tax=Alicyclobacillus fastidiosus TaxID=392011 RepID=A0ABY6ZGC1_9BACL|nr:NADP-dependent oxidoreductase [Alicyclobacillus fastidiosus]WAH41904.1 NADP-dependent oxidoreductase [Alicyclobacillus fastidiosus]GMA63616.1 putative NADP-dependent oxidoreductase YfmJ [Alicyclobacillus fastidiosus]
MSQLEARRIVLASRPKGKPTTENFRTETVLLSSPSPGEVLVKALYLSVDPYMRGRMSESKSYVPPYEIGGVVGGGAVAEVVESNDDRLQPGDIVSGQFGWQTYAIVPAKHLRKIDPALAPITASLGLLGVTGLTAYFGLVDICKPQRNETVVVSGAAGAVGMTVGQIAKILGCRVVGVAGSDEKVRYLTEQLGFDEAINYKTAENMTRALKHACPNGIDVYFDNVGGDISDAAFRNLNTGARISVCGQIALYNLEQPDVGPRLLTPILIHRALVKGFIITDYADRFPEGVQQLAKWYRDGQLKFEETIAEGFDQTVEAFLGLFTGANLGKQIVRV